MKLLMLSLDASILEEQSYVRKRLFSYADYFDKIEVLVLGLKDEHLILSNKLEIFAVKAAPKSSAFWGLLRIGRERVKALGRENLVITSQDPFFLGIVAFRLARKYQLPLHIQIHVDFASKFYRRSSFKQKINYYLAQFVLRRANQTRAVSEKIANFCRQHLSISPSRIDIVPLLVDVEKIQQSPVADSSDLRKIYPQFSQIILMASRLTRQKNVPLAVQTFQSLKQKNPTLGLVIVGRGEEEANIKNLISDLGLSDSVKLLPWSNNIPSLMKSADVFLLSSDYEGYVMTAMEASIAGLPVVMTDVGGAHEFIENQYNGLIVPVGDQSALSAALERVLSDKNLREKLSAGAREHAGRLPSYPQYIDRIVQSWQKTTL